jgi:hypothetical protein
MFFLLCFFRSGWTTFLTFAASRIALGPTHPPIPWAPGALSRGVKRPRREADHSHPSSAEVKEWVQLYLHSPDTPSWRSARLKKEAQGKLYLSRLVWGHAPQVLELVLWTWSERLKGNERNLYEVPKCCTRLKYHWLKSIEYWTDQTEMVFRTIQKVSCVLL